MVTHIDIAEKKLGFSKFTLNDLAQTLKVSYGLARKYALEWIEDGRKLTPIQLLLRFVSVTKKLLGIMQ